MSPGYAAAIGRTPIIWDNWNTHQAHEDASTETLRVTFGPYWRRVGAERTGRIFVGIARAQR